MGFPRLVGLPNVSSTSRQFDERSVCSPFSEVSVSIGMLHDNGSVPKGTSGPAIRRWPHSFMGDLTKNTGCYRLHVPFGVGNIGVKSKTIPTEPLGNAQLRTMEGGVSPC